MKITQIKAKAKELSIKPAKMSKDDLIRAIQVQEGNFACFKSATDYCDQLNCTWRSDCCPNN